MSYETLSTESEAEPRGGSYEGGIEALTAAGEGAPEAPEAPETPSVEAPAEPAVTTPDDPEAPAPDASDEENEDVSTDDPATDDPFASYGGRETIEAATRLYEASKTEEGRIQIFLEAAKGLGIGYERVEELFRSGDSGGEPDAPAEEDPDRPLTYAEWQKFQQEQAAKEQQTQAQRQFEEQQVQARAAVQSTFDELKVDPKSEQAQAILRLGETYFDKQDLSPEKVAEAVRRGHADYTALIEKERKAYLAEKEKAADVPSAPAGGATPPPAHEDEPKDVAEASKRAMALLKARGAI